MEKASYIAAKPVSYGYLTFGFMSVGILSMLYVISNFYYYGLSWFVVGLGAWQVASLAALSYFIGTREMQFTVSARMVEYYGNLLGVFNKKITEDDYLLLHRAQRTQPGLAKFIEENFGEAYTICPKCGGYSFMHDYECPIGKEPKA